MFYSEWLKFRRSALFWMTPLIGAVMPLLFFIFRYSDEARSMGWENYIENSKMPFVAVIVPLWISMVAGQTILREKNDHTLSVLYTYPISRINIVISKLSITVIVLCAFQIVEVAVLYLTGCWYKGALMPQDILNSLLLQSSMSLLGQIAIMPIFLFISQLSNTIIIPICVAIGVVISNFTLLSSNYFSYSPFAMFFKAYPFLGGEQIVMSLVSMNGVVFMISLLSLILYTVKMEIRH
jgi:hypothetical protein